MAEGPPRLILVRKETTEKILQAAETWWGKSKNCRGAPSVAPKLRFFDIDAKYYNNTRKMFVSFADMWKAKFWAYLLLWASLWVDTE